MINARSGANLLLKIPQLILLGAFISSNSYADKVNPVKVNPNTRAKPGANPRAHLPTAPARGSTQNPDGSVLPIGDTGFGGKNLTDAPRAAGIPQSSFVDGLKGILSEADAKALYSEMLGMSADQMQAVVDLTKQKASQPGVKVDKAAVLADIETIRGQELQKAEAARLLEIRKEIDADPAIKAELDAAIASPAGASAGLAKLIADTVKLLPADLQKDTNVLAKIEAAQKLAADAGSSPEALGLAREAVEELVALKNPKYSGVCGPCGCK